MNSAAIKNASSENQRRIQLLLVEDNPAFANVLMELLKENDFHGDMHWVENGKDALDFMFRIGKYSTAPSPDFVILDLNLPFIQGGEVLKRIKNEPNLKHIPVVVLTTSDRDEDLLLSYRCEASSFIVKPPNIGGYENLARRLITVELARRFPKE